MADDPTAIAATADASELAILDVLDCALVVAEAALLARRPELTSWDGVDPGALTPAASIAASLITEARTMRGLLARYHLAVVREDPWLLTRRGP